MVHAHSRRTSCAASEVHSPNHHPGDLSAAETRFEPSPNTSDSQLFLQYFAES
ncbi:MAG: hypothetical protein U9P07_06610 [Pseudomonadota bacterium]|nr:hypothetical protein [Pseudomonadota bacterium]